MNAFTEEILDQNQQLTASDSSKRFEISLQPAEEFTHSMGQQVFLPGQQAASGLFLGWWEASCCLLSRFSSALRCGAGADTAAPRQETAGARDGTHRLRLGTLPIQDPLHPDHSHPDHPHLAPSITPAIPMQDHPPLDPPPPLPTPPAELLLRVSTRKMYQTHAMRGSLKTSLDSGTRKNRPSDP